MNFRLFVLILLLTQIPMLLMGQDDCEKVLNDATEEFNAGHFYSIPVILKPCIDNGFTKEQRQRAYLLLTQTYLLLEDPVSAELSYLKVLKANPEYITDPNRDPIEVVYLSKKFTADPSFLFSIRMGGNTSPIQVIQSRSTSGINDTKQYFLKFGWQAGIGIEWNITDNISFSTELGYSLTGYRFEKQNNFHRDTQEFMDRQTWMNLPLSFKYTDASGKYRPYGYVGYGAHFLLTDKASIKIFNEDQNSTGGEVSTQSSESPALNFITKRNRLNYSLFLGGGIKYKRGLDYVFFDVRYAFGLTNVTKSESYADYAGIGSDYSQNNVLESSAATWRWGHVDDFLRMDNLSISIGYVHPFYKPRKMKKAKTKSVLRKIKRGKNEI